MSTPYKTTGLTSRLIIFLLVCLGVVSIVSVYFYDPLFSGWSYTTDYVSKQTTLNTILTYIADTYFTFFGTMGIVVPWVFALLHLVFLFQRSKTGFNWFAWLGFIISFAVLFFGLGVIYNLAFSGDYATLYGNYDQGGFTNLLIKYFFPGFVYRLIIGVFLAIVGFVGIMYSMLMQTIMDYFNYLSGKDLSAINMDEFKRTSAKSAILEEARKQQEERLNNNETDYLKYYILPSSADDNIYQTVRKEYQHLQAMVASYNELDDPSTYQQQTKIVLNRMLEHKREEYVAVEKRLKEQSLWFSFVLQLQKMFGKKPVEASYSHISTLAVSSSNNDIVNDTIARDIDLATSEISGTSEDQIELDASVLTTSTTSEKTDNQDSTSLLDALDLNADPTTTNNPKDILDQVTSNINLDNINLDNIVTKDKLASALDNVDVDALSLNQVSTISEEQSIIDSLTANVAKNKYQQSSVVDPEIEKELLQSKEIQEKVQQQNAIVQDSQQTSQQPSQQASQQKQVQEEAQEQVQSTTPITSTTPTIEAIKPVNQATMSPGTGIKASKPVSKSLFSGLFGNSNNEQAKQAQANQEQPKPTEEDDSWLHRSSENYVVDSPAPNTSCLNLDEIEAAYNKALTTSKDTKEKEAEEKTARLQAQEHAEENGEELATQSSISKSSTSKSSINKVMQMLDDEDDFDELDDFDKKIFDLAETINSTIAQVRKQEREEELKSREAIDPNKVDIIEAPETTDRDTLITNVFKTSSTIDNVNHASKRHIDMSNVKLQSQKLFENKDSSLADKRASLTKQLQDQVSQQREQEELARQQELQRQQELAKQQELQRQATAQEQASVLASQEQPKPTQTPVRSVNPLLGKVQCKGGRVTPASLNSRQSSINQQATKATEPNQNNQ